MEKVAICLYGHIRSWEKCKQNFIDNISSEDPNLDNQFTRILNQLDSIGLNKDNFK